MDLVLTIVLCGLLLLLELLGRLGMLDNDLTHDVELVLLALLSNTQPGLVLLDFYTINRFRYLFLHEQFAILLGFHYLALDVGQRL